MGHAAPPFYGKSDFYQNEKEKALKEIARLQEVVKECDEEIAKQNEEENK